MVYFYVKTFWWHNHIKITKYFKLDQELMNIILRKDEVLEAKLF